MAAGVLFICGLFIGALFLGELFTGEVFGVRAIESISPAFSFPAIRGVSGCSLQNAKIANKWSANEQNSSLYKDVVLILVISTRALVFSNQQ